MYFLIEDTCMVSLKEKYSNIKKINEMMRKIRENWEIKIILFGLKNMVFYERLYIQYNTVKPNLKGPVDLLWFRDSIGLKKQR